MAKIRVAVIAGGQSSEHEISCISANGVLSAIDREKFEPLLIGITKSGKWVLPKSDVQLTIADGQLPVIPEDSELLSADINGFASAMGPLNIDVIFPVLHGPYGEDGTFQGACEMAGYRYVGSGVLASAVAMDKSFAKAIFTAHGLKVAAGFDIHQREWPAVAEQAADRVQSLGLPVFVKPARGGSSRGTTKVKSLAAINSAIEDALNFDTKVMIEKAVVGREIECAVLQEKGETKASGVGEIRILGEYEFYDFTAKYLDNSTEVLIPADIPADISEQVRIAAVKAFNALGCEGLARVDFFYSESGEVIINEINTMPGFTSTSVYPKLWKAAGKSYSDLITSLLESALTRSMSVTR